MDKYYPSVAENVVLPFYDIIRRTSRFKFGRTLQRTQWLTQKEVNELQAKNLRALIKHAYETVPYYRRLFKQRNLSPDDIENVDMLTKLPPLTKADIRENFEQLVSRDYPANMIIPSKSGGTGDQISFYATKEQASWEVAAEFRAYRWAGYRFGDRCLMFWGSPLDLAQHKGAVKRFTSVMERIIMTNTYVASDEVLAEGARLMQEFDPEIIRGYTSSIYMMAKYIIEKGVDIKCTPRAVITSAETLLDFQRNLIEKAFRCPVFDYYGSREIGAIASECEKHHGYHISAENVILEFVKEGEHVAPGEDGVILVTNLRNFGMPFIRYAIGDVGKPSNDACPCGRGLPLLSSIEGRVSQFMAVFDKRSGKIVPVSTAAPGPISIALMQVPLESYRIVQESLDRIVIMAVRGQGYSQEHTDLVVRQLSKILGDNVSVEFRFVDYLQPLPSGKRSVFISKISSFQP